MGKIKNYAFWYEGTEKLATYLPKTTEYNSSLSVNAHSKCQLHLMLPATSVRSSESTPLLPHAPKSYFDTTRLMSQNMIPLCICILVRNTTSHLLLSTLQSVKGIAQQIRIGEHTPSQETHQLAEQYGADVVDTSPTSDQSDQWNLLIESADTQWILQLAAGDVVQNAEDIAWICLTADDEIAAIDITIHSRTHAEMPYELCCYSQPRLFRNDVRLRCSGLYSATIIDALLTHNLSVEASAIDIFSETYTLSSDELHAHYCDMLVDLNEDVATNPANIESLLARASARLAFGDCSGAERDCEQVLLLVKPHQTRILVKSTLYAGLAALRKGAYDKAISFATESLSYIRHQQLPLWVLGNAYTALGNYQKAILVYQELEATIDGTLSSATTQWFGRANIAHEDATYCIGITHMMLGDYTHAERYFRTGLHLNSSHYDSLIGLVECFLQTHHYSQARQHALTAAQLHPQNDEYVCALLARIDAAEQSQHILTTNTNTMTVEALTTQSAQPLLSLCMIVKNEAQSLPACLESVRGVVDEIVIVDTGSNDSTQEIALSAGAILGTFPWTGDFAAARNHALSLCTGSWIVYLDADERLDIQSAQVLRDLVLSASHNVGALLCTIVSPHRQPDDSSQTHKGGYPRVFRNYGYPHIEFRGRVHEQISPSILECGGMIIDSPITIFHTGYDIDRNEMETKVKRNYDLLLQHVKEEPLNAYAWFQLGQTLSRMGMNEQAEETLKFAINVGTLTPPIAASAASSLAYLAGVAKRYSDAIAWADYSLEKVPNQLTALNYKAHALLYNGKLDDAEYLLRTILACTTKTTNVPPSAGFEVDINPAVLLQSLQKIQELRKTPSATHNNVHNPQDSHLTY